MSTDHHSVQRTPIQAYVLAPMFAPLIWLLAGIMANLAGRGLSLHALGMRSMFLILLLAASYLLCIPLLFIWARCTQELKTSRYAGFIFAVITAATIGLLYAQPQFQDARTSTRNLIYLTFMLLTCLGMFDSLKNFYASNDKYQTPAHIRKMGQYRSPWGIYSLLTGSVAIILIAGVNYLESINFHLDISHYFAPQNGAGILPEEAYLATIFDISPNYLIDWCFYATIILAMSAIASALLARMRLENSLYRAIGCICGVLAFAMMDPRLVVYAMLVYGLAEYAIHSKSAR
ncbi:hypothetical protein ACO0LC_24145 [Undibacterium sp. JH2W]|uniref:hypothetical protein n=1 Tax=Undibacterium sp. JH2W TaxID=3413037 RepID=UPI003BF32A04